MTETKQKLIVIAGPTAVGKSAAAVRLAKRISGEIISADSMQVYRGMDIGTAKISAEEMQGVPHHLIDVISPAEDYNVVRFQQMAKEAIRKTAQNGHIPILCGGTGFYIQALLYDIDFTEENGTEQAAEAIRDRLSEEAGKRGEAGNRWLHGRLSEVDPEAARTIPENNRKRVIRALEFYQLHGKKISEHNREQEARKQSSPFDYRFYVLSDERNALYERINERVSRMLRDGLCGEVSALLALGVRPESTAMQGIGYREIAASFRGEYPIEEAVRLIRQNSRHYAKRQLTWFRREGERVRWIDVGKTGDPAEQIAEALFSEGFLEH